VSERRSAFRSRSAGIFSVTVDAVEEVGAKRTALDRAEPIEMRCCDERTSALALECLPCDEGFAPR
jgi:hypothetical protein